MEEKDAVTQTEKKTEVSGTQPEEKKEEKTEAKTFTQEEVNAMLAKEKNKMPNKDELKAFREWKESQKTEAEKLAEKEAEYQRNLSEKEDAIKENKVFRAGVNKDEVEFVAFKVSKIQGDFEENLAKFLKENPKYLQSSAEQQVVRRTSSSVSMGGKTQPNQSETNQIMNDLIRSARD